MIKGNPFTIGAVIFLWFPIGAISVLLLLFGHQISTAPLAEIQDGSFQFPWWIAACVSLLFVVMGLFNAFRSAKPFPSRREAKEWMEREYGENKESEAETRAWFNKEESDRGWWAGSDDYIDYDGFRRNVNTHKRMYMNQNDTGNGKNKLYH